MKTIENCKSICCHFWQETDPKITKLYFYSIILEFETSNEIQFRSLD